MIAKSLDVYALAKLLLEKEARPYAVVANELGMSASEFHAAVKRLGEAGLIDSHDRHVRNGAVRDFLFYGLRYVFPARKGVLTRGLPTSYGAPPLDGLISSSGENIPVWPDASGEKLGYTVDPLHPSAPKASRRDGRLYEILTLIDALREGRTRERGLAEDELGKRINRK